MSQNQLQKLRNRLFSKKGKTQPSSLTSWVDMIREFGCLDAIIGREFEIIDPKTGKVIYVMRQKPIKVVQLNVLLKEIEKLRKIQNEAEKEAMEKSRKKGRRK